MWHLELTIAFKHFLKGWFIIVIIFIFSFIYSILFDFIAAIIVSIGDWLGKGGFPFLVIEFGERTF